MLGITAALHGNELNGIPLIHRLVNDLKVNELHGTIVAVPIANIQGYVNGTRGFNGSDLNRLMPGKENASTPQLYCYQFMQRIVKNLDYLIDLHTASKGRVNSLYVRADMLNFHTSKMAKLQMPEVIFDLLIDL